MANCDFHPLKAWSVAKRISACPISNRGKLASVYLLNWEWTMTNNKPNEDGLLLPVERKAIP